MRNEVVLKKQSVQIQVVISQLELSLHNNAMNRDSVG